MYVIQFVFQVEEKMGKVMTRLTFNFFCDRFMLVFIATYFEKGKTQEQPSMMKLPTWLTGMVGLKLAVILIYSSQDILLDQLSR